MLLLLLLLCCYVVVFCISFHRYREVSSGQIYAGVILCVYKQPGGLCLTSFENFNPAICSFQQIPWMANVSGVVNYSISSLLFVFCCYLFVVMFSLFSIDTRRYLIHIILYIRYLYLCCFVFDICCNLRCRCMVSIGWWVRNDGRVWYEQYAQSIHHAA